MRNRVKAEIIAVGTEILLGQIVNTNARFLSEELAALGLDVYFECVVGDNVSRLEGVLKDGLSRSDVLFITGGLGPTADDLTKETAAAVMGFPLELDIPSLEAIKRYFDSVGRTMTKNNKKQALIPKGAYILKNSNGTAPGCIMEKNGKYVVLLPGPPKEMRPMFLNEAKPFFEKLGGAPIYSRVLRIFGIGESAMEDKLGELIKSENPTVAPYAKEGEVTLRVSAKHESREKAFELIDGMVEKIKKIAGDALYGEGDDSTLCSVVSEKLIKNQISVSVCESCTGGLVSAAFTDIPGISSVLYEGAVTYSNEAKMRLGVKKETLEKYGAVSAQTAEEMARCIKERSGSDCALSTTGIAGPDGGSAEKPVGLVYIALAYKDGVKVRELKLAGSREKVRHMTVMHCMDLLNKTIFIETEKTKNE